MSSGVQDTMHDAVAVGISDIERASGKSEGRQSNLTDSQTDSDKRKRLSVSLNKAMRTHRGAHVRKLAEIHRQVSTPTAATP